MLLVLLFLHYAVTTSWNARRARDVLGWAPCRTTTRERRRVRNYGDERRLLLSLITVWFLNNNNHNRKHEKYHNGLRHYGRDVVVLCLRFFLSDDDDENRNICSEKNREGRKNPTNNGLRTQYCRRRRLRGKKPSKLNPTLFERRRESR